MIKLDCVTQELVKFVTEYIPVHASDCRSLCVVCRSEGRGKVCVQTYCSAPQCKGQLMHVAKEQNCFATLHSIAYQHNNPRMLLLILKKAGFHAVWFQCCAEN